MARRPRFLALAAYLLMATLIATVAFGDTAGEPLLTIAPGKILCIRLHKRANMRVGSGVTGTLAETVYVRDRIAIQAGTRFIGHVSEIADAAKIKRIRSIMDGDFTPPHEAMVQFDYVVASDGRWLPVRTKSALGIVNETEVSYSEDGEKTVNEPKRDRQIKQHVEDYLVHKLPYHGQHVSAGDVFHAEIAEPLEVIGQGVATPQPGALLTLQLVTPLDTNSTGVDQPVQAVVSAPYFSPEGTLLFPEGTAVMGRVTDADSAGMLQHSGRLRVHMDSAQLPGGGTTPLNADVAGIESSRGDHMKVDREGALSTSRSKIGIAKAASTVVSPARSAEDPSLAKTGFSRATHGLSFGVLGSAASQAGANTATGFAAYGAAKALYWTFIGPGKNVVLPAGTRIELRLERDGKGE